MVYNYTIPRRPIAAMYSSPGPCYALPSLVGQRNHDPSSTHPKGPGYHMGKRIHIDLKVNGPGPKYYPNPKYLRNGLDAPPSFSHSFRPKDLKKEIGPGPADYSIDGYRPDYLPKYSFGMKHMKEKNYNNPAPNQYVLPRMTGGNIVEGDKKTAPSFSMISRHHSKAYISSPGPAKYAPGKLTAIKTKEPHYSMAPRTQLPKERGTKPGPGAHDLTGQWGSRKSGPKFSFGMKHSNYEGTMIVDPEFRD